MVKLILVIATQMHGMDYNPWLLQTWFQESPLNCYLPLHQPHTIHPHIKHTPHFCHKIHTSDHLQVTAHDYGRRRVPIGRSLHVGVYMLWGCACCEASDVHLVVRYVPPW